MNALNEKTLVLGIDGLDPRLTSHFMGEGLLPNFQKLIKRGSTSRGLKMMGGVPTITPPMWTTLCTGATPATHGITCFWGQSPKDMATFIYNLNSKNCQAEQIWNVLANEGKKTLVWHWPGSSWPPSSQSEYLHVVDGTQPSAVGNGDCIVDDDKIIFAGTDIPKVLYQAKVIDHSGAGCVLTDVLVVDQENLLEDQMTAMESVNLILSKHEGDLAADMLPVDLVNSPIGEPSHWAFALPQGAKELTLVIADGFVRRPGLVLQNDKGIYDRVAIYKNKKEHTPLVVLEKNVLMANVLDEFMDNGTVKKVNRHMRLLEIDDQGNRVKIWLGAAMEIGNANLWHPTGLKASVVENVGPVPATSMINARDRSLVKTIHLPCWDIYTKWQADALNHLIKAEDYQVVFSHVHNVDACGHLFWYQSKRRVEMDNDPEVYQEAMAWTYQCTDRYIGSFLHLLDEGWTILVVSDHGLLVPPEDEIPLLGDGFGCNIRVMEALGYTVLKKDAQGQQMREIDYSKTRAVANRGNHIHLNLKGRNPEGIVAPEDQYALETQIINDLYGYRQNGERIVSIALRNKDAAILGLSGDACGDIIYFLEEGYNRLHGDSLPTFEGIHETSVSPIFIAAGRGIKADYVTDRVIRMTDVAPTIAALAGIPMPAQCEGAPIYQILTN